MGSLRRQTVTKPLPPDAVVIVRKGKRLAQWTGRNGTCREAEVVVGSDGNERIRVTNEIWQARFRRHDGTIAVKSTGCRDRSSAQRLMANWEDREEKRRSGLLTDADLEQMDASQTRLDKHLEDYLSQLRTAGRSPRYLVDVRSCITRVSRDCGWVLLRDVTATSYERWLADRHVAGMGASTRNSHTRLVRGFARWAVKRGRLRVDPLQAVSMADVRSDRRHERRSLTPDELARLLAAAEERPLQEASKVRSGEHKGKARSDVPADVLERARLTGRERRLTYEVLVTTGLRKGELQSLTVGQARLDGPRPFLDLAAADEKARNGAAIPLRADVAEGLRSWLADRLRRARERAEAKAESPPLALDPSEPLLALQAWLVNHLDKDLEFAGIPKFDDRGRVFDVHAFRMTFATLMATAGVPLRTAQAAMRHSDPRLTANTYTDPHLLDVHGAVESIAMRAAGPHEVHEGLEMHRIAAGAEAAPVGPPVGKVGPPVGPREAGTSRFKPSRDTARSARELGGPAPPVPTPRPKNGPDGPEKGDSSQIGDPRWRRGRDSNPRNPFGIHRISNAAHSASLPPLQRRRGRIPARVVRGKRA
jgi:integrase